MPFEYGELPEISRDHYRSPVSEEFAVIPACLSKETGCTFGGLVTVRPERRRTLQRPINIAVAAFNEFNIVTLRNADDIVGGVALALKKLIPNNSNAFAEPVSAPAITRVRTRQGELGSEANKTSCYNPEAQGASFYKLCLSAPEASFMSRLSKSTVN